MNHHHSTLKCTLKNTTSNSVALKKMNPEMDTSEMRVPLPGVAKFFEAGLKSKTWDIHGMPQFITTTHREGCETCDAYALHVVKASEASMVEILSREVEKAFQIAWPNIVHHIEDETSLYRIRKLSGTVTAMTT